MSKIYQKLTSEEVKELSSLLKEQRIKKKDLAIHWGVTAPAVSNWLRGKNPAPKMLIDSLELHRLRKRLKDI